MLLGRKQIWIKGDSIGIHKHLQEDEVVFVHRGHVQVTLGDSSYQALTASAFASVLTLLYCAVIPAAITVSLGLAFFAGRSRSLGALR